MTPSDSQGRRSGGDPEAHEHDPTGIRALLSALPDPGPMPQDLVERIEARLAVEHAHREQATAGGLGSRSDSVVDLAAERSHRRPGRTVALLGAAAAGLLVATVAIGELGGVGTSGGPAFDSAAQVPARSAADSAERDAGAGGDSAGDGQQLGALGGEGADGAGPAEGGAGTLSDDAATGDAQQGAEEAGDLDEALPTDVLVLPVLGAVHADDYPERIMAQAGTAGADSGTGGLTPAAARSCWRAVETVRPWTTVHAAQAEMDGDRVVVLLGADGPDADPGQALVLPWSCTTGADVEPLHAVAWPAP
ncbi:hypothetical protein [Ornithinimicrobium pekingense]|uniref:Uncharacterized protein n=1 Tax=Ornithinimicrobium pekingense TaxID=384677 RepID=A0ABQ2FAP2_9MICO|nr:hypothetical protein [Ornithinimicrobium pekingense]GGK73681.1 hypothetical protein GCM10011509_22900 [Ornithinimicrobium pekingense]